jgi:hypothetical protein
MLQLKISANFAHGSDLLRNGRIKLSVSKKMQRLRCTKSC